MGKRKADARSLWGWKSLRCFFEVISEALSSRQIVAETILTILCNSWQHFHLLINTWRASIYQSTQIHLCKYHLRTRMNTVVNMCPEITQKNHRHSQVMSSAESQKPTHKNYEQDARERRRKEKNVNRFPKPAVFADFFAGALLIRMRATLRANFKGKMPTQSILLLLFLLVLNVLL